MIEPTFAQAMARYNRWQNDNLFGAAEALCDTDRRRDRGAFFGSIHRTLNHLVWADEVWMGRFAGRPHPTSPIASSPDRFAGWDELRAARRALDTDIEAWAVALDPGWLAQSPTWSSKALPTTELRNAFFVVHFFNHQTHHRGQVHALLTAAGATPGDTDLLRMPR